MIAIALVTIYLSFFRQTISHKHILLITLLAPLITILFYYHVNSFGVEKRIIIGSAGGILLYLILLFLMWLRPFRPFFPSPLSIRDLVMLVYLVLIGWAQAVMASGLLFLGAKFWELISGRQRLGAKRCTNISNPAPETLRRSVQEKSERRGRPKELDDLACL
jgi:hypothetical protein